MSKERGAVCSLTAPRPNNLGPRLLYYFGEHIIADLVDSASGHFPSPQAPRAMTGCFQTSNWAQSRRLRSFSWGTTRPAC